MRVDRGDDVDAARLLSGYADDLSSVADEVREPHRSHLVLVANSLRNLSRSLLHPPRCAGQRITLGMPDRSAVSHPDRDR